MVVLKKLLVGMGLILDDSGFCHSLEQIGDNGQHGRSCRDEGRGVLQGDAANGTTGDVECFPGLGEEAKGGLRRFWFCVGGIYGTEGNVVCSCCGSLLGQGKVLVAGGSDDGIGA